MRLITTLRFDSRSSYDEEKKVSYYTVIKRFDCDYKEIFIIKCLFDLFVKRKYSNSFDLRYVLNTLTVTQNW